MKKEKNKDIKLIIPENWNEISILKYGLLASMDNDMEGIDKFLGIISILTDHSVEKLKTIPADYIDLLADSIKWISTPPQLQNDLSEITVLDKKYQINNKSYHKLTMGEMVSIETLLGAAKDTPNDAIAIVLGILMRKVLVDGTLSDFDGDISLEQIEVFKEHLCITDALSLIVGFGNGENNFMKTIQDSLVQKR